LRQEPQGDQSPWRLIAYRSMLRAARVPRRGSRNSLLRWIAALEFCALLFACSREPAHSPATTARLNDKIAVYHPDLVLVMEGTNDLDSSNPGGSITSATNGIQTLVQLARSHGAVVFVATITPEVASELTHGGAPELVPRYNAAMTPVAIAAGAKIVDIYGDLSTDVPDWISPLDGLHPTEAGYAEIAKVWFAAIEKQFESVPTGARTTGSAARTTAAFSSRRTELRRR
jgi:hypothetical protein